MSSNSREVIWGGWVMGAKIHAQRARERAQAAVRDAEPGGGRSLVCPHRAGLDFLLDRKMLIFHESGTYVKILDGAGSLLAE